MQNDDLIIRSALLDRLNYYIAHSIEPEQYAYKVAHTEVEIAPAVDAVPVVHARWVDPCINKYGHPCHHCSRCRFKASQKDRNFCPNCGARMDAEDKR